ncbi:ATP-binding protein [Sulfurimonas diazotrophicus]|uniref:ATP-binding protein n=1 Tax=Sulfurimonas diazotrophicus TaxID=3131939 RepID=A0ABZ3HA78_9BACT
MYLKKIVVENYGPIDRIDLEARFSSVGHPTPIILVGENGSGKTTLLSSIADALMEFAAKSFDDVLTRTATGHKFFKISGSVNTKTGRPYGLCFFEFENNGTKYQYIDKNGQLSLVDIKTKTNNVFSLPFKTDEIFKIISDDVAGSKDDFKKNTYCFFPSNRFEVPHWMNSEIYSDENFKFESQFVDKLKKPILIASSMEKNRSWLMDLVLDSHLYGDSNIWASVNSIIRAILGVEHCRFGIGHRTKGSYNRISIGKVDETGSWIETIVPSITNLSMGQSVLLNVFLTVMRYGDHGENTQLNEIEGIVLIDEVDLHLHSDLQSQTLPNLIALFPKIQFIITTHSPLFVLGMESRLGAENVMIVDMPYGMEISSERFREFESAFQVYEQTRLFEEKALQFIQQSEKHTVFVEGPTDKMILHKAIELYAPEILSLVDVQCAEQNGGGYNWVKDMLLSWHFGRQNKKAIGLFDFDRATQSAIGSINGYVGNRNNFKVMKLADYKPAHLIKIFSKGIEIPFAIEEMFDSEFWEYFSSQGWLKRKDDVVEYNRFRDLDISFNDYCIDKGLQTEDFIFFQTVQKEKKLEAAHYICSVADVTNFMSMKKLVEDIKKYFEL